MPPEPEEDEICPQCFKSIKRSAIGMSMWFPGRFHSHTDRVLNNGSVLFVDEHLGVHS